MRYAWYICILLFVVSISYFGILLIKTLSRMHISVREMQTSINNYHKEIQNGERRDSKNEIDHP